MKTIPNSELRQASPHVWPMVVGLSASALASCGDSLSAIAAAAAAIGESNPHGATGGSDF